MDFKNRKKMVIGKVYSYEFGYKKYLTFKKKRKKAYGIGDGVVLEK